MDQTSLFNRFNGYEEKLSDIAFLLRNLIGLRAEQKAAARPVQPELDYKFRIHACFVT